MEGKEVPTQSYPQQWLRQEIIATWIAILNHKRDKRGMILAEWQTRAIRRGDIHEVITTPETIEGSCRQIDQVYYLGFAEFEVGILAVEDGVWTEHGTLLGHVIGFDETHAPNHLNILLTSPRKQSGQQLGLKPGERLFVRKHEEMTS